VARTISISNPLLLIPMLNSRENYFQNIGVSEVFQKFVKKEGNPRALRKVDHIVERLGVALVEAVRSTYEIYLEDPKNPKKAENYRKWRLRLHMRAHNNRDQLELISEYRNLGLNDTDPGELCWDYDFPFEG